jgi:ABC-type sugar transport system substrate-binding protein
MPYGAFRARGRLVALAMALFTGLAVAACSSGSSGGSVNTAGSSSGDSASGATATCITKAEAFLKNWDAPSTKLPGAFTPLAKAPKPGGKVIRLVIGTAATDVQGGTAMAAAANAIGWSEQTISYDGTPADLSAKFAQAVSEKPTVIVVDSQEPSLLTQEIAAAKAAGIVVSLSSIPDIPTSFPGYSALSSGIATSTEEGQVLANWMMRDSKCTGNAVTFSLAGIPGSEADAASFVKTVQAQCPACKAQTHVVQLSDLGTSAVPTAVTSILQADPSIKYLMMTVGNLADGLSAQLTQANITGVKIFGGVPDAESLTSLQAGTNSAWVNLSENMLAWNELDAALRSIEQQKPIVDPPLPLALLTSADAPPGTSFPTYPLDYQSEFEKLWHVS